MCDYLFSRKQRFLRIFKVPGTNALSQSLLTYHIYTYIVCWADGQCTKRGFAPKKNLFRVLLTSLTSRQSVHQSQTCWSRGSIRGARSRHFRMNTRGKLIIRISVERIIGLTPPCCLSILQLHTIAVFDVWTFEF